MALIHLPSVSSALALVLMLAGCASPDSSPESAASAPPADPDDSPPVSDSADDTDTDSDTDTADDTDDPVPPPSVRINELMAANRGSTPGPEGALLDWVELVNLDAEPVDLSGWALTDDWRDPLRAPLPDGLVVEPGERVLLWLDPDGTIDGTVRLGLAREGEVLRLFDPREEEADFLGFPDQGLDEAWARIPDGTGDAEAMPMGTPGATNVRIVEQTVRLVPEGASDWKYLDGGQVPEGGMDGPWSGPDFDDSAWLTGQAPLGYGDTQSTVIDAGVTADGKALTAFFRRTVEVDASAGSVLDATIGLRADDGARVWIDGVEVYRLGLPDGEIGPDTAASRTASGEIETTFYEERIDPALWTPGTHVIAVDLHQVNRSSSDMTMDLWVELEVLAAEE